MKNEEVYLVRVADLRPSLASMSTFALQQMYKDDPDATSHTTSSTAIVGSADHHDLRLSSQNWLARHVESVNNINASMQTTHVTQFLTRGHQNAEVSHQADSQPRTRNIAGKVVGSLLLVWLVSVAIYGLLRHVYRRVAEKQALSAETGNEGPPHDTNPAHHLPPAIELTTGQGRRVRFQDEPEAAEESDSTDATPVAWSYM